MMRPRILLLEDPSHDSEKTIQTLEQSGIKAHIHRAASREEFLLKLHQENYALILAPLAIPELDIAALLAIVEAVQPDTSVVVLAETGTEGEAIEALQHGASDYVLRDDLRKLVPTVQRALRLWQEYKTHSSLKLALRQSETRYRQVIDSIEDYGIFAMDLDGNVKSWNSGAETILGYTAEEVLGKSFAIFFTEEDRAHGVPEQELSRTLAEGRSEDKRWHLRHLVDGHYQLFWASGAVNLIVEDGKPQGFTKILRDETASKLAEERMQDLTRQLEEERLRLQSSELRYRLMAEAMPVVVWTSEDGSTINYINQRWTELTGLSQSDTIKRGWTTFVHPEDMPQLRERWTQAIETGSEFQGEYRLRSSNGSYFWYLGRGVPARDADGRIVLWIGTATPVDEQKRSQNAFRFLSEASKILASSLDYQHTLRSVAQLAVPTMADWCAVDIVGEDGAVERLAVAHVDPEKVKWAYEIYEKYPPDQNALRGIYNVIRTGRSEFYPEIEPALLKAAARSPEHLEIIESIGFSSAITVPLVTRDMVLGAISLVMTESGRHYTAEDLALAEELGLRAAAAIDNAWLYRKAQDEIEERKKAEEAARLGESRFRTLIEQAPLSIQIYSREGNCLQANHAWEEMFATPASALEGYNVLSDVQLVQKGVMPYIQRAFSGETVTIPPIRYDPEEIGKEGRARWVRAFAYTVKDPQGEVSEIALILEDVTERLEVEEDLRLAMQAAESANRAKDKFLAILSHELRTPLTPVLTTIQALETEEDFPAHLRPWLDLIHRNVELEARLIDDLLDLTRISKGKLKLSPEPVDLHALIGHVVDIYKQELDAKGLRLQLDLCATRTTVHVDSARVQQVLWNLLKNAVKFTPQGGSITIRTADTEAGIHVEVSDTGIGIDAELLPRIFDAFEQGTESVHRHFGGLGLGLAISKNLIDMHGGEIHAFSEGRNQGSTFSFELPIQQAQEKTGTASGLAVGENHGKRGKSRLLLVDDHTDTSLALKLLLERREYTVETASSVQTALKAFQEASRKREPFDLVISDIGLPDGSGLELMHMIREKQPALQGIALSGFGSEEDIRRSKEAGFAEHLTKPFSFQRLEEVVRHLLS